MLRTDYLNYVKLQKEELEKNKLPNEKQVGLEESLKKLELLIPVVGTFSAGKSTLLNTFLGKEYLLTGITPETALATELHYSEDEYFEAIKLDGGIIKYEINEAEKIRNNASKYKYIRAYMNNENLKKIYPLILVDMPGFDSPLDEHNKAIKYYLDKGAHYVILTSVEEGTITKTMIRNLENIQTYGRDFSFFLSKTDLRPSSDIEAIKEQLEEQIEINLLLNKKVESLSKNDGSGFNKVIENINIEEIIKRMYFEDISELHYNSIDNLNLKSKSLKMDKEEIDKIIKELKNSIEIIKNKKERKIEEIRRRGNDNSVKKIVGSVLESLSNSTDEIVNVAMTGDQARVIRVINDIIFNTIMLETKEEFSTISGNIIQDFKLELEGMKYEGIDENFVEKIGNTAMNYLNGLVDVTKDYTQKIKEATTLDTGKIYKIGTTILGLTTAILSPMTELVIIFLPEIIKFFTQSNKEKKQREELASKMNYEVFPKIGRKVESELKEEFNMQVENLIEEIGSRLESEIEEKNSIIQETEKENEVKKEMIEEELKQIEESINILNSNFEKLL